MQALEHYQSEVATVRADAPVRQVADRLAEYAIGCVVIVSAENHPVGIVTDRDLLCRVVAAGRDPATTQAGDIMSRPLVTADAAEPLEAVAGRMRTSGVRRLPVLRGGRLSGIVTLDDLVYALGRELDDLGEAMRREVIEAREAAARKRRRREWRADLEARLRELREDLEGVGEQAREALARELKTLRERLPSWLQKRGKQE